MSEDNNWYIYGAGGLGLETAEILSDNMKNGFEKCHTIIFVDDFCSEKNINGYQVVSFSETVSKAKITIAVGEPEIRNLLLQKIQQSSLKLKSIISCRAYISPTATIEEGVIVAQFCSVQARAFIGLNVAVNTHSIIGHDVKIHEGAVISSMVNLGGASRIGPHAYLGMGSMIKENIELGKYSILSMGSILYTAAGSDVIVVGNPARVSKKNLQRRVFSSKDVK